MYNCVQNVSFPLQCIQGSRKCIPLALTSYFACLRSPSVYPPGWGLKQSCVSFGLLSFETIAALASLGIAVTIKENMFHLSVNWSNVTSDSTNSKPPNLITISFLVLFLSQLQSFCVGLFYISSKSISLENGKFCRIILVTLGSDYFTMLHSI